MGKLIPDEVRDRFRQAALEGTRQLIGRLWDGRGGYCAVGLLGGALRSLKRVSVPGCHLCGATEHTYWRRRRIFNAAELLVHLNNDHRLDWLGLAKVAEPGEEERLDG